MPKNVTQLLAELDAQLPTNGAGLINAATLRSVLGDIVTNFQVTASQINTTSGAADNTTTLYGDNTWKPAPVGTSGGGFSGNYLVSNATVQAGTINYCDTSAGGFGVTIPTSPTTGNVVCFRDAVGTWDLANLSVLPGGHNIDGNSGTFTCDVADANFDLIWRGDPTGWSVQFIVAPLSRRPTLIRTGVGASFSTANVLGIGRGTAVTGAGSAAGIATVLALSGGTSVAANWNPSDKHADITLSGSNLIATKSGSSVTHAGVRGTPGHTMSHRYFEGKMTVNGTNGVGFGLSTASHTLANYLGSDEANGVGVYPNGYIEGPGIAGVFTSGFAVNDIIGIELLPDPVPPTGSMNVYKNGSLLWHFSSVPSGTLYPATSLGDTSDSATANFGGSAFAFSPPSGATAWNSP